LRDSHRLVSFGHEKVVESETHLTVREERAHPPAHLWGEPHLPYYLHKARVIDVVEEALDVEQHDPTLESGAMSSLDIVEKSEARI
jgi:hypothetical protein